MSLVRAAEGPRSWFRAERVFLNNDAWYFHTREGVDVGPYPSQFEAEIESGMLKEMLRSVPRGEPSLVVIREFVLDSYAMGRPLAPGFSRRLIGAAAGAAS